MRRWFYPGALVVLLAAALLGVPLLSSRQGPSPLRGADDEGQPVALSVPAPDFPGISAWLNTKPLRWPDLRGRVVVVHFWTFG
jgi:hypothetical protein